MERTELINFLRENLTVNVTTERCYDFGTESVNINVSIGIVNDNGETEIVASGEDYISIGES